MWTYRVANDRGGRPRWWLSNGDHDIAYSGESFDSDWNATRAAEHFKENAALWRYVTFEGGDGRYYWHARARNGENVAASGRSYPAYAGAAASAESVRINGGSALGP